MRLAELFAGAVESIDAQRRDYVFRYRSPAHWLEVFRTWYGPVHKAFGALDPAKQDALAGDIEALMARFNRARDGRWCCRASTSRWLQCGREGPIR